MANIAFPSADRLRPRTAHPYRDLDVIDARAPRFNQVVVGTVSLLAVVTGWWPLLALLALQLGVGLRFGRQYCLPCLAYFELIQPRFGEGELEDSRPPRFANKVGFVFLSAASVAYLFGFALVGAALGLIVASLALLAAVTGFCMGCWMYKTAAPFLGVHIRHIDAANYCAECSTDDSRIARAAAEGLALADAPLRIGRGAPGVRRGMRRADCADGNTWLGGELFENDVLSFEYPANWNALVPESGDPALVLLSTEQLATTEPRVTAIGRRRRLHRLHRGSGRTAGHAQPELQLRGRGRRSPGPRHPDRGRWRLRLARRRAAAGGQGRLARIIARRSDAGLRPGTELRADRRHDRRHAGQRGVEELVFSRMPNRGDWVGHRAVSTTIRDRFQVPWQPDSVDGRGTATLISTCTPSANG